MKSRARLPTTSARSMTPTESSSIPWVSQQRLLSSSFRFSELPISSLYSWQDPGCCDTRASRISLRPSRSLPPKVSGSPSHLQFGHWGGGSTGVAPIEWRHADHKAYCVDEDASPARHFLACHPRSSSPLLGAQRGLGRERWRDPPSSNGRHRDARCGPDGPVLPPLGLHSSGGATVFSRNRICSRHRGYFLVRRTTEPGARLTLVQPCELPWW